MSRPNNDTSAALQSLFARVVDLCQEGGNLHGCLGVQLAQIGLAVAEQDAPQGYTQGRLFRRSGGQGCQALELPEEPVRQATITIQGAATYSESCSILTPSWGLSGIRLVLKPL